MDTSMVSIETKILECREVIQRNLVPTDILDTLESEHYISDDQRDRIRAFEENEWKKACKMLLSVLRNNATKGENKAWGNAFVQALDGAGYKKLSLIIQNYPEQNEIEASSEIFYQLIKKLHKTFRDNNLDMENLLLYLQSLENDVIGDEDQEHIRSFHTRRLHIKANRELLRRIFRKSTTWFPDLLWALVQVEKKYIVEEIIGELPSEADLKKRDTFHDLCSKWVEKEKAVGNQKPHGTTSQPTQTDDDEELSHRMFILGFADQDLDVESAPLNDNMGNLSHRYATNLMEDARGTMEANAMVGNISIIPKGKRLFEATEDSAQNLLNLTSRQIQPSTSRQSNENFSMVKSINFSQNDFSEPSTKKPRLDLVDIRNITEDDVMNITEDDVMNITEDDIMNITEDGMLPDAPTTARNDDTDSDEDNETEICETKELELRSYQLELAQPALEGKNTIIVAPTGTGKTHVALWSVKKHLENWNEAKMEKPARVVFLAPTVALVKQQAAMFKTYLPTYKTKGLAGDDTTPTVKIPFENLCADNTIIVATPQLVLNAVVRDKEISLKHFSMLILDECHHANTGNHPYKELMRHYLREKFPQWVSKQIPDLGPLCEMPQLIGLTASVGVGKAKTKVQAIEHIFKLCGCLDTVNIKSVTEHIEELEKYQTVPIEDIHRVHGKLHDPFKNAVRKTMQVIELLLEKLAEKVIISAVLNTTDERELKKLKKRPVVWDSQVYSNWIHGLGDAINTVRDEETRRTMYSCIEELKMYNDALFLNDYCRCDDALELIHSKKEAKEKNYSIKHQDKADLLLQKQYKNLKTKMEEICKINLRSLNPKLTEVKNVILQYTKKLKEQKNTDMRGMIFCKTRDMTLALEKWMHADPELKQFNAHHFTSHNASSEESGLSSGAQTKVLEGFRRGLHKVLIATTVAEEGLDIPECNLVIRYNHVTNETARIQSKGRGRAVNAHYVLIGEGNIVEKEEVNRQREQLMKDALGDINKFSEQTLKSKVKIFSKEIVLESDQKPQIAKQTVSGIKIKCGKCLNLACSLDDIRKLKDVHYVVVNRDIDKVSKIEKHPKPKSYDGIEKVGKLFCNHCHHDWGIQQRYKGINFPTVKIVSFAVENEAGKRSQFKKWTDIPFKVEDITQEEVQEMADFDAERVQAEMSQSAMA